FVVDMDEAAIFPVGRAARRQADRAAFGRRVGKIEAEAVDAPVLRHRDRGIDLAVAVVPGKGEIAPHNLRIALPARAPGVADILEPAQRLLHPAGDMVAAIALLRDAADGEGDA